MAPVDMGVDLRRRDVGVSEHLLQRAHPGEGFGRQLLGDGHLLGIGVGVAQELGLPLVTVIALDLPYLFAGALFTEIIFGWPGMGRLAFDSVLRRDYPVIQGMVLFLAIVFMLINLLVDLSYTFLDPRIRY